MRYDDVVAFYSELQRRVLANDSRGVAELSRFPLHVNGSHERKIQDADKLVNLFQEVFTPTVRAAIQAAEPKLAFCRDTGAMLGDGVLWATDFDDEGIRLYVVNQ